MQNTYHIKYILDKKLNAKFYLLIIYRRRARLSNDFCIQTCKIIVSCCKEVFYIIKLGKKTARSEYYYSKYLPDFEILPKQLPNR